MANVTPAQRRLAKWLLAQEMGGEEQGAAVAEAAGRAWERLSRRLANMFTSTGSQSLGKRAVYLARDEFPFLSDVRGAITLDALPSALDGEDREQAAAAAEAVYANLIGLLVTFIGESLALRALHDVWPGASLHDSDAADQEATG